MLQMRLECAQLRVGLKLLFADAKWESVFFQSLVNTLQAVIDNWLHFPLSILFPHVNGNMKDSFNKKGRKNKGNEEKLCLNIQLEFDSPISFPNARPKSTGYGWHESQRSKWRWGVRDAFECLDGIQVPSFQMHNDTRHRAIFRVHDTWW